MNLLLDTHVFIWWNAQPQRIAPPLRQAIGQPGNSIFISAASVWEIAIKRAIGRLAFSGSIAEAIDAHRFEHLAVTGQHAERVGLLPQHHSDPFDRMLIAQAHLEGMVLGTQDASIRPYGVATLGV